MALNTATKPGREIGPGDVRSENGFYSVVFYYTPTPKAGPLETARTLAKRILPSVEFCVDSAKSEKPPLIGFEEELAPLKKFPVLDVKYFKRNAFGLSSTDVSAMQKTRRASRLLLVAPASRVGSLGRKFTELVTQFADITGAFVWDSATREVFSAKVWRQKRLRGWKSNGIPDLRDHITIHLYQPDKKSPYLREITLGMEKFALPDIVVERMIASDARPTGNLINMVCQLFAEGPILKRGSPEDFSIDNLRIERMRARLNAKLEDGATGTIRLLLRKGRRRAGDSDNRLIELGFDLGLGQTEDERRDYLFAKLWGAEDSVVDVPENPAIPRASERARKRLRSLRPKFLKGLAPGSTLLVKGPFARDDVPGNEWMWVEVLRWRKPSKIEGVLRNQLYYTSKLRAGSNVTVEITEVFDYILRQPDGTSEGNETGGLMERRSGHKSER